MSGSGDECIWSVEAAILAFSTSGLVTQYSQLSEWKAGPKIYITPLTFRWYLVDKRRYNGLYLHFMRNFAISGFAAAILEFRMVMDMPGLCHLLAQTYLGKVTKAFQSIPCGSEMAAKRSVLGVLLPPPLTIWGLNHQSAKWRFCWFTNDRKRLNRGQSKYIYYMLYTHLYILFFYFLIVPPVFFWWIKDSYLKDDFPLEQRINID